MATINEERLSTFQEKYLTALKSYAEKHPEILEPITIRGNTSVTVIPGKTVEQLTAIMINAIRTKGIHGVSLSLSMKKAAKEIGINGTYKAIEAYLQGA
jgi:hypothetical protein